MQFDMDLFVKIIAIAVPFLLAVIAAFAFLIRSIGTRFEKSVDEKFKTANDSRLREDGAVSGRLGELSSSISKLSGDVHRLERDMPREYVRREDHVQALAIVNAKIDAIQSGQQTLIMLVGKLEGRSDA
jgi:outer membrane murein-binding lipoprotein Lpp